MKKGNGGYFAWHDSLRKKERNDEIYKLWLVEEWSQMRLAKHFSLSHWRIIQILKKECKRADKLRQAKQMS